MAPPPPQKPARPALQVGAEHYHSLKYDGRERFASYWSQIDFIRSHKPVRMLEIGIGSGFLAHYLRRAGIEVITLDIDRALAPSVLAALPHLPFRAAAFDLVVAFEVLEHIPWELFKPSLQEMARVSRGPVGFSVPNKERVLRVESSFGKRLSFRWLIRVPKLRPRKHRMHTQHYWEIGKRGYGQRFILRTIEDAGLEVRRHWRPFECPAQHFFDLLPRRAR